MHRPPRGKTGLRAWLGVWGKVAKPLLALAVFPKGWLSVAFATLFSCGLFWGNDSKMLPGHGRPTLGRPRSLSLDAGLRGRSSEPSRPAVTREERERIALEARQHLRSLGIKRYGTFLKELKARGLSVTTSEAAELYHRVEPAVYSSAHAQVASAFGGVEPPTLPPGPSASSGNRTGRGDLGQPVARPSASLREPSRPPARPVAAASAPVAEDPEEGATLAELESSFLSPFDPETESLEEYEVRLHQGVEMACPDCRDEAISLAECCLGEAQFRTAFSRFTTLCRSTPAAARPDGPDHVLRARLGLASASSCRCREQIQ